MGHNENVWLENYKHSRILSYRRYVDVTFCVFEHEQDAVLFYNYMNSQDPNIHFIMEKEADHKLAFLDVLVHNNPVHIRTSVQKDFHRSSYQLFQFYCFLLQNWSC